MFLQNPVLCHTDATKSSCLTATEKSLSTIICRCYRYRSQPLSSVSRKQRYNTLDFASKIVCQQGCCSPLLETQSRGISPLWTPHIFFSKIVPKLQKCNLAPFLKNIKPLQPPSYTGMKIATVLSIINLYPA